MRLPCHVYHAGQEQSCPVAIPPTQAAIRKGNCPHAIIMIQNTNDRITVNHSEYTILRLLGKGKGGYSYLVRDDKGEYVLKQIHHEPCDYYQFGDKLASELRDYATLRDVGIPMPELIEVDESNERILKAYIPGPTAAELAARGELTPAHIEQVRAMCRLLYPRNLNIDYYPTNFVLCRKQLYYVDYECNPYMEQWDFEHWGAEYWKNGRS
jgi:hypothetical protein